MANFCCSIEMEPRTLNQGQLNHAREIAVDIVQKKETNEASNIFIEGLEPIVEIKEVAVVVVSNANPPREAAAAEVMKTEINVETCCQCSCTTDQLVMESPLDACRVKEPLSAPF
ncbi:hypothetical protein ACJIZ3_020414 [Penstemon smallii]|uniref:Uncharacterized protein n=1 Tax=Penstemon smallii TaxID=265156 RepID=A0ABD3SIU4_9LAMI